MLGYFSVAFAFGLRCRECGYPVWTSLLISMTNLTSAGQFAIIDLMLVTAGFAELALTMFVINIRYSLAALALGQKIPLETSVPMRMLMAFGLTDEVFALGMQVKGQLNPFYYLGMVVSSYIGWQGGTLMGAVASDVLPNLLRSAMGIAIYGMFIAIVMPQARNSRSVSAAAALAAALSCICWWLPPFNMLSVGWRIIICACSAASVFALISPVPAEEDIPDGQNKNEGDIQQ